MKSFSFAPLFGLALLFSFKGCVDKPADFYQGYMTADLVYAASPVSGRLEDLPVERGSQVKKDDILFVLEEYPENYAVDEAQSAVEQVQSTLQDMNKGARPEDIQVLEDAVQQAQAQADLAKLDVTRIDDVYSNRFVSASAHDQAVYRQRQADAALREATDRVAQSRLAARPDQMDATKSLKSSKEAAAKKAQWMVDQKTQRSRYNASVYDVLYHPGEWVPAGQPVVALLVPKLLRARFFVTTDVAAQLKMGQTVLISQPGDATRHEAAVNYVSSKPEYTPPVIFSRDNSQKQVFRVEATPKNHVVLFHPGLPVEVRLAAQTEP